MKTTTLVTEPKTESKEAGKHRAGKLRIARSFDHEWIMQQEPIIEWRNKKNGIYHKISFLLPMPPSLNSWTRIFRNRAVASPVAKLYMQLASGLMQQWGVKPSEYKLNLEVDLYGIPARSDVDNRLKQILDSMQGTLIENDYQFRKVTIEDMEEESEESYIQVTVTVRRGAAESFTDEPEPVRKDTA